MKIELYHSNGTMTEIDVVCEVLETAEIDYSDLHMFLVWWYNGGTPGFSQWLNCFGPNQQPPFFTLYDRSKIDHMRIRGFAFDEAPAIQELINETMKMENK